MYKNTCPLERNCNIWNIIYQAEVTTRQTNEHTPDCVIQHSRNTTETTHVLSGTIATKM